MANEDDLLLMKQAEIFRNRIEEKNNVIYKMKREMYELTRTIKTNEHVNAATDLDAVKAIHVVGEEIKKCIVDNCRQISAEIIKSIETECRKGVEQQFSENESIKKRKKRKLM